MNSIGKGRVGRIAISASAACLLLTGLTISAAGSAGATSKYQKTLACEVTDTGGVNDRSFNASAYLGLKEAAKVSKLIKTEVQSTPTEWHRVDVPNRDRFLRFSEVQHHHYRRFLMSTQR